MEYQVESFQLSEIDPDRHQLYRLAQERETREHYRTNPADWMYDVLGIRKETIIWSLNEEYEDHVWDGTEDPINTILLNLSRSNWVAAESAVGTGKSYICAAIILWFLANWPLTALVHSLAPRKEQLSNIWKHVQDFWPSFKLKYPDAQLMASNEIRMFGPKDHRKDLWVATGTTAQVGADENVASSLRGSHSPDMLFIVDETPGVDDAMLKAIELTCTDPHNIVLFIGNPTGEGDNLNSRTKQEHIVPIRISALDHPNVVKNDYKFIRGATSMSFINRETNNALSLGYETAEEAPDYMINVRGICPIASDATLVPVNLLAYGQEWFDEEYQEWILTNEQYRERPVENDDGFFSEGRVKVFELPRRGEASSIINNFILTADIAGSSSTGDWHSATMLNRTTMSIAATIQMRGSLHNYLMELYRLGELFKVYNYFLNDWDYPIFAWETNGVGAGFAGDPILQNYPYDKLYKRQSIQKVNAKPNTDTLGWWTGSNERVEMERRIVDWAKLWKERPEIIRDPDVFSELKTLVYKAGKRRFEAKSGCHDDLGFSALGIALAINNQFEVNGAIPRTVFKINDQVQRPKYVPDRRRDAKKKFEFDNIKLPKRL